MSPLTVKMWYILAIIIFANAQQIRSFDQHTGLSDNSGDVTKLERIVPEEIVNQLTDSFSKTFSRRTVASVMDKITENIKRQYTRFGSADIFDIVVNLFLTNNEGRFRKLEQKIYEYGNDIEAILKFINLEIGANVFRIDDSTVSIDANTISHIFQKFITRLIADEFSDNLFLQLSLTKLAKDEIRKTLPVIESFFDKTRIQLREVQKLMAVTSVARSKRSTNTIFDSILEVLRVSLRTVLSPIQESINTFFNTAIDFFISFYVPDEPTNSLLKIITNITNTVILRLSDIIATAEEYVNRIFNEILYGNGTSTATTESTNTVETNDDSAVARNINIYHIDNEYGNRIVSRQSSNVTESTNNSFLSGIADFFSSLTSTINSLLKNIFVNLLSSSYQNIGELVTYPIRYVFQLIVNFIFNCGNNCTSIL